MAVTTYVICWIVVINVIHCQSNIGTACQGTECTLEDLQTTTNTEMLQNLTATIASILQSQLKIHITHDYQNSSCEASPKGATVQPLLPRDCTDIAAEGNKSSGYYKIKPKLTVLPATNDIEENPLDVYCDMETDGGGWTVFQRRMNGAVDFYRGWEEYKLGFGYLEGGYWLGLENLHKMTAVASYELRVDLEDFSSNKAYAHYNQFHIKDEGSLYKLHVGSYHGTAGDSLRMHNNMAFSTKDRDNDNHSSLDCAERARGAWWYNECDASNLNGLYLGPSQVSHKGINWYNWKSSDEVMKRAEMKIRRVD